MAHNKPEGQRFILDPNHLVLRKNQWPRFKVSSDGQEAGKKKEKRPRCRGDVIHFARLCERVSSCVPNQVQLAG